MSVNESITNAIQNSDDSHSQFLSFLLGDEEYGVPILGVREIIGLLDITPVPQTPAYVKGVINLRGKIIPVIELRTKFGMESVEFTEETCIIVVEVTNSTNDDKFDMGVIVDNVSEVQDISSDQIEPAPNFGSTMDTSYIFGMGKVTSGEQSRVVILLDIDKVVSLDDVSSAAMSASADADAHERKTGSAA